MIRVRTLFAIVSAGLAGAVLPSPAAAQALPTCAGAPTTAARFAVTFDGTAWSTQVPHIAVQQTTSTGQTTVEKVVTRITDRDRVEVCVEHFNFLRYTLKFDVAEQQSEAYAYLTKLWTSVLNPLGAAPPPAASPLVTLLHDLYRQSRILDGQVEQAAAPYTKTGLTGPEATALSTARTAVTAQLIKARTAFTALDQSILGNPTVFLEAHETHKGLYTAIVDHYRAVETRAEVFLRLSGKSIGIEIKRIGKKKAGTKVTFTLAAIDESGAATPMDDVDYFVQSNMPLVAHGGLSFSGLRDVTFSKVRRATRFGEEDLFQEQSADDTSTGFALFLGWQFYGRGDHATNHREGKVGAAFSLGTDVNAPGKRVFAGPSLLLFNRLVITGGAVFGKEAEGDAEPGALEPNLFRIIREKPKAKFFFAVSTKVF
jgi:hypothetical protein